MSKVLYGIALATGNPQTGEGCFWHPGRSVNEYFTADAVRSASALAHDQVRLIDGHGGPTLASIADGSMNILPIDGSLGFAAWVDDAVLQRVESGRYKGCSIEFIAAPGYDTTKR